MNLPGFRAACSLSHSSGYRETKPDAIHAQSAHSVYPSAMGQDFPGTKCTCKGCASGGGDLNGQCSSVCKDKTVYSKGSEPYDYCKAAARGSQQWWRDLNHVPSARFSSF